MQSFAGKRLVILGCGYVGTAVALEALSRGMRVSALTRSEPSALMLREQGIEAVAADLAGEAWHDCIAAGPEFVLNSVSSGGGGLEGYRRSYVDGMASIVAWARRGGRVGTLVYTSSTSVYPQDGGAIVDETASTEAVGERGGLLLEAENQLRGATEVCQRWFVLRLAGIYGPGRHHFIDQARSGEMSGRGENRLNLAHRDDIVAAIWSCFAAPEGIANEVFNVADDAPAPKAEVAAWIAAQAGRPPPRFTEQPLPGRRAITPDRIIANEKLKTRLGWRPRYPSFREGCRRILEPAAK